MTVHVELYGIPRQRTGASRVDVAIHTPTARLGDILLDVGRQFPMFADECLHGDQLRRGITVNLDGDQFVEDPETLVATGQSLLIMSADAGG